MMRSFNTLFFALALLAARSVLSEQIRGPAPERPTFRNHVQPILAKFGCSGGACHGALAGKGGFKLSLRGYDTEGDYFTITRQARGRRIELDDPGRSLILTKPTGALPHKGGVRFDVGSEEYRLLSDWIAAGANPPTDNDPLIDNLEVQPVRTVLKNGEDRQMTVLAHFSDGHVENVTRWAKYASTNESVALVDDMGRVTVVGQGEGSITAWYLSRIAIATITVPHANEIPKERFANAARGNFIDGIVLDKLKQLRLAPSPQASDEEFIRRAHIDTLGVLPLADRTRAFLADERPDKRDRLIDELLARNEFVDYWTYKWSDMLLLNSDLLSPDALQTYYGWIRNNVRANTPWDKFARQIVVASGSTHENGATNFYTVHDDPQEMTENICVAFMGLNINCARCHNHPLEKWTNNQYYAMANLFARVRAKGDRNLRTVYVTNRGDLIQPLTGRPQPPASLDGSTVPIESTEDRRLHLADWLTSHQNPYFSRAITNRVWQNFFGVGLVEPVDDLRTSNPASNEQLLDTAASYLLTHNYDLKALMRAILQSETYQRSSRPLRENSEDRRFYSRYYPRRMMAEVILDTLSQVTGVPTEFKEVQLRGDVRKKIDDYPLGTRALQLRDSAVFSYFLRTFGRNERQVTCECERTDDASMVQVLHLSNGDTLNGKLQAEDNRIDIMVAAGLSNKQIIEETYLIALSRLPSAVEHQQLGEILDGLEDRERRIGIEDFFWGILSSREFLFNH